MTCKGEEEVEGSERRRGAKNVRLDVSRDFI